MRLHLPEILKNFLSARKNTFADAEEETRFLQYSVFAGAGLLTMITFGIYNFVTGRYFLCLIILLSIIGLIFGWLLLYRGKAQKVVYRGNSLLFCLLLLYVMSIGGEEHSMILWMYITPLVVFFLMGRVEGLLWTSFIWVFAALYFFGPLDWQGKHDYGLIFSVRFLVTYTVIAVITYFYENFRFIYRNELMEKNKRLIDEINERKKIQKSLKESESRYRAIYLHAAEGILLINLEGEIVDCNPQIYQMFGYQEKDLLGRNIFTFFHDEDLKKLPSQINKMVSGETIFIERRIKTANGKFKLCEQSGKKVNDDLIILLYRDITQRKIAEIALEKANQALDRLAHIDGLTQIANRRKFDMALHQEWQRMKREQRSLGIIISDIDFFKQYNDIYGHQAGDDCLKNVAAVLSSMVHRPGDLVARFGGEEFVILLPDTEYVGCEKIAEAMRSQIESMGILHEGSKMYGVVTMSFGVAVGMPDQINGHEKLLGWADKALYLAKEEGRNRTHSHKIFDFG